MDQINAKLTEYHWEIYYNNHPWFVSQRGFLTEKDCISDFNYSLRILLHRFGPINSFRILNGDQIIFINK